MLTYDYEQKALQNGYCSVCGVDEAGRGPLAGPVCAAAVILPADLVIEGLNDSKKLTEKKRERLFDVIKEQAIAYSIAFASVEEIETYNILQATFLAMTRAVQGLTPAADFALIDGNKIPPQLGVPAEYVIGGDGLSPSVAAASVLAKVTRDRYMLDMEQQYPGYGFAKHKGYGTKDHREAIVRLGPSPIHRLSFLKNILK
ncbi:MAG: ribonuclease HII [Clostridia bacterium]|nr:ribonuclease HII [Clostridia bacterium]